MKLFNQLSSLPSLLLQLAAIVLLTAFLAGCSNEGTSKEDQAKMDRMSEELKELKEEVDNQSKEKEEAEKELEKANKEKEEDEEDNKSEKDSESKEESNNNNSSEESTKTNNNSESLSTASCSTLTEKEGTIFNSSTRMYVDGSGNEYLTNLNYDEGTCYSKEDYYSAPFWGTFIQEYNEALVNYYNDTDPAMENSAMPMPTVLKYVGPGGSGGLADKFFKNKDSGNFGNHSATINIISIDKYSDRDVVVTAERTYSHDSGSGTVVNKYYIDVVDNRLMHFEEAN